MHVIVPLGVSYPGNRRKLVGLNFVLSVTRWAVWSRGQQSEHTGPPKSSRGNRLNRLFKHADFDNLLAEMHDDSSSKSYWIKSPPNRPLSPPPPPTTPSPPHLYSPPTYIKEPPLCGALWSTRDFLQWGGAVTWSPQRGWQFCADVFIIFVTCVLE